MIVIVRDCRTADRKALLVCFGERTLEALNPTTGERLWSVSTGSDEIGVPLSIVAVQAVDGAEVFFGSGSSVLAVDPSAGSSQPEPRLRGW